MGGVTARVRVSECGGLTRHRVSIALKGGGSYESYIPGEGSRGGLQVH